MTTKWGTCNTSTRKIWLNLQLAKKPIECLEYVILHELAHLKVKNHGEEVVEIINTCHIGESVSKDSMTAS